MWEEFTNWVTNVTNNPAFIALMSVVSVLTSILVIINKTSFGKKAIKMLTDLSNGTRAQANLALEKVEEAKKQVEEFEENIKTEFETAKSELNSQFIAYFNQLEFFEGAVFEIFKAIPNAKVQEQLKAFMETWEAKKKEIQEITGQKYSEIEEQLNKREEEIAQLKEQLNQVTNMVTEFINNENGREDN